MVLSGLANFVAGAYKGYMNAEGQDVDSTYLAYVLAGTSAARGIGKFNTTRKENADPYDRLINSIVSMGTGRKYEEKNPATEGALGVTVGVPVGAIEIALGYGLGYIANKIIK
jgi:hypothetical protein